MNPANPSLSLVLIVITAAVSLVAGASGQVVRRFAISPWAVIHQGRWYQMLTSGFLHAGLAHLVFNMLTLYFFGPAMEMLLGGRRFLVLYFGSLLAGSLATLLIHRRDPAYRAVGASGAITGVLFGFVLFRPTAPIYMFFIPIGIPAVLFAAVYMVVSIWGLRGGRGGSRRGVRGGIGHAAHLGGAIGGIVLTVLMRPDVVRIFLSHFQ